MNATPMPAITACLIVSLLFITLSIFGAKPRSPKNRSIDERVPEPCSRTRKRSPASASSGIACSRARGCDGGAITTSGWSAKGTATVSKRWGGVPMIARSISLRSSSRTITSRLLTESTTRTSG